MATLQLRRLTSLLLERICKPACSRKFNASALRAAKPIPRKSPRVVSVSESRPGTVRRKTYDIEEAWPPVVLLDAARKSGALDIEPEEALDYIRDYLLEMSQNPREGWERRLCEEHGVTPHHMAILAGILRKCPSDAQRSLAQNLMLAASELGERSATFEIVDSGIRTGNVQKYEAPLRRLGLLAKKENDSRAMLLLGKYLKGQRGDQEALQWFQKATRPPTGSLEFDGAGEALVQEGRILLDREDAAGARAAFERAALELDEPTGYFYLSKLEEPGSPKQEAYLLKASMAGLLEAWHNLGALEMERIDKREKKPTSMDDYGMAREYFEIAASDGFGLSMINMALMNKAIGNVDEGLVWLDKAGKLEEADLSKVARALRTQWTGEQQQSLS